MKKILLLCVFCAALLVVSCSDGLINYEYRYITKNELEVSLDQLTVEQAFLETVRRIYDVPVLDQKAVDRVNYIFNGFQTGTIHKKLDNGATTLGIGYVTSPHAASAIVQYMYMSVKDDETNPLYKALTYRNIMDDEIYQKEILDEIYYFDDNLYRTMIQDYKLIAESGSKISEICKLYENMLLDSTSSASKTSGGSGTVLTDKYQVSANVAYFVSRLPYTAGHIFEYSNSVVSRQIADALYEYNEASKLKITYDKTLKSFMLDEVMPGLNDKNTDTHKFINKVMSDIASSNGYPGGLPRKDDVDDEIIMESGYSSTTTDATLYSLITTKLYGAPDNASNMSVNRTLEVYKKLKENGLRVPVKKTSDVGFNSLSDIVSKHIRANYYAYLDFQKDSGRFNTVGTDGRPSIMQQMFTNIDGVTGTAPVCALIAEFNKAVEDAERAKPIDNCAMFDSKANGRLCNISVVNTTQCF